MKSKTERLEFHFRQILKELGHDVDREGLKETPKRYIKFLTEYSTPKSFKFTTFKNEGIDELIVVQDIPFTSLCEHHGLPFLGVAHVAYLPKLKMAGLSKIPRTVNFFAERLQNQERITQQIGEFLSEQLETDTVGVILTARHLCMEMRGVRKHGSNTTTSYLKGALKTDAACRAEFMGYAHNKK